MDNDTQQNVSKPPLTNRGTTMIHIIAKQKIITVIDEDGAYTEKSTKTITVTTDEIFSLEKANWLIREALENAAKKR